MQTADFTIADVLAWARTKPADEAYDYTNPGNCAICQFLRETGRAQQPRVIREGWRDGFSSQNRFAYPDEVATAANNSMHGWTFGAFARRLEALLPAEPLSDTWTKADAYLTDIEDVARERCSA